MKTGKSKIDNIIDMIMGQRNITMTNWFCLILVLANNTHQKCNTERIYKIVIILESNKNINIFIAEWNPKPPQNPNPTPNPNPKSSNTHTTHYPKPKNKTPGKWSQTWTTCTKSIEYYSNMHIKTIHKNRQWTIQNSIRI